MMRLILLIEFVEFLIIFSFINFHTASEINLKDVDFEFTVNKNFEIECQNSIEKYGK